MLAAGFPRERPLQAFGPINLLERLNEEIQRRS